MMLLARCLTLKSLLLAVYHRFIKNFHSVSQHNVCIVQIKIPFITAGIVHMPDKAIWHIERRFPSRYLSGGMATRAHVVPKLSEFPDTATLRLSDVSRDQSQIRLATEEK